MSEETKNLTGETQVLDSTTVEQIDVNIDDLFGTPGAENIMLPADGKEEKPKSLFSKETTDLSFFDNPNATPEEKKEANEKKVEVEETIAELDGLISQEEDAGNKGRPKVDKSGLYDLASKMIEEGELIPFDDDKSLEDYTTKDFRELFEANFKEREAKIKENTPKEFFSALPEELQYAAKYVADGGTDLKGLFRTLAQVEEMRQLDPADEYDQAEIARQYLYATNFGTSEEIETEITDWSDLGKLEQKANQFKPKLDRMQEEIVARQLAEQEQRKEQQSEAAKAYTDNVYNTLVSGELDGVKLDKKVQNMLYSGLVQPNYPSISGKPTNMLGHLLEKYQFVEPRHDLIAEALWLLADPNGYKAKIKEQGGRQATEKVVRQLKTEEARKSSNSIISEPESRTSKSSQKTLSRNTNMFKRF
jgi:GTPase SAR1 family protein